MNESAKLSVTIITLNEAENIGRCLKSIKGLSDEIVVVDSGSKDKTVEIVKKYDVKLFHREFDNYANQKNYAADQTSGNWVFSIDADEVVTKKLRGEIKKAIIEPEFDAYSIPRCNIIFGKFIRFTRWQPELDRHVWLWKKSHGRWRGNVHEEVKINGSVGRLKNPKIHYQYETISQFWEMMNKYSELDAEKYTSGDVLSKLNFYALSLFLPIYHFFLRYIYRLGFLDGWRGFVLSYLMAIYQFNVIVKKYENSEIIK